MTWFGFSNWKLPRGEILYRPACMFIGYSVSLNKHWRKIYSAPCFRGFYLGPFVSGHFCGEAEHPGRSPCGEQSNFLPGVWESERGSGRTRGRVYSSCHTSSGSELLWSLPTKLVRSEPLGSDPVSVIGSTSRRASSVGSLMSVREELLVEILIC